jgi:hypothetical protein
VLAENQCQTLVMNKKLLDIIIRDYYLVYFRLKTLAMERKAINKQAMADVAEIVHRIRDRKQTLRTVTKEF